MLKSFGTYLLDLIAPRPKTYAGRHRIENPGTWHYAVT